MRHHVMRAAVLLAGCALVAACGGESVNNPTPRVIAGGGAGDGAIKGALHVYVVDGLTGAPITGAAVRVGAAADTAPLQGTTDTSGLATFKDGKLKGAQMVTVTAASYAAATWIGVDAVNVTIPLEATAAYEPATAKATGTIQGWDTRTAPAAGHLLLAYVGYSYVSQFDSPENSIAQGTQTVPVIGITLPTNLCYQFMYNGNRQSKCEWQLNTRTGKQALWAVVIDVDTHNTVDRSDDTATVVDYAFLLDQDYAADHTYTGVSLVPVGTSGMTSATVAFQAAPTNMASVAGLPVITMGDQGNIVLAFAPFGPNLLSQPVPSLTGSLAAGKYDFIAQAKASDTVAFPQSTIWTHDATLGSTISFGAWQLPPTGLTATSGTYSFTAVTGASLHTVKFLQTGTSGTTVAWNVGLLDGSTSFTLPALSPSPLPNGSVTMRVEALKLPTFDPTDFSVDSLRDDALQHSADQTDFTR